MVGGLKMMYFGRLLCGLAAGLVSSPAGVGIGLGRISGYQARKTGYPVIRQEKPDIRQYPARHAG